ncbi:MAG: hypothetical protein ACK4RK_01505 [Gemmataceae bacterium]
MIIHEIHDLDEARQFLWQGWWLQQVLTPASAEVRPVLEWGLEIAAAGQPLPPLGFVADVGHVAFGFHPQPRAPRPVAAGTGLPAGLIRTYEDLVLGKIYADWSFERAGEALRRYQGRDRARGLAFLLDQFRARAAFDGVLLNPAVIKGLLDVNEEEFRTRAFEAFCQRLLPVLPRLYESLIAGARRVAEILGPEDIFELETGTALAELGQRLALRQVLQAAELLAAALPSYRPRPLAKRQEVPTRVRDEDIYPVGGYASLATRGSIESLLHSQLAFMEPHERPDLFDLKFLRDELLYYARDENQFLRRRRDFLIVLFPDLTQTRFKDAELPWQRGILLLGLLVVMVHKLCDWLSTEALTFTFLFVAEEGEEPLRAERELLETILRAELANQTARMKRVSPRQVVPFCSMAARRGLCHCLTLAASDQPLAVEHALVSRLHLDGPVPFLITPTPFPIHGESDDPVREWGRVLETLVQVWL